MIRVVAGEGRRRARQGEDPPYSRYAFLNPYNLSLVAGAATTAAATGQWWIGICAVATEAIWLLFAPESKMLQRALWDKRWEQAKRNVVEARQNEKYKRLTPDDQSRAGALRDQRVRIYQLAAENPSMGVDMMTSELAKLDALFEDYLDLAIVCGRCERQLAGFDLVALQRSWQTYSAQLERFPKGDSRRDVAEKNLQVLAERRNRMDAMQRNLQVARGHMDLMDNSFRLLGDEIVSIADPTELGQRLDDLRIGVQAIRETSEEVEADYEEAEPEPAGRMRGG
jgi:hypothetical protein